MVGTIKTIVADRAFGFIHRGRGEADLFFHIKDLDASLEFGDALEGLSVEFEVIETPKGPRASRVRAAI